MMKQRLYKCRVYTSLQQGQQYYLIDTSIDNIRNYLLKNQCIPVSIYTGSPLHSRWFEKKDLLTISQQFLALLKGDIPLVEALSLLIRQQDNRYWQALLIKINELVQEGHLFSDAIARFPMAFPNFYREIMKTSDDTGQFIFCQERIITILTKQLNLKKKINKGLRYPVFLLVTLIIVVILITQLLLPQFQDLYTSFSADLPFFTTLVMQFSNGLQDHMGSVVFFVSAIVLFAYYGCYYRPFYLFQFALLKIPLFGKLLQHYYLYTIFQHLALTEKATVPLLKALTLAKNHIRFLPYQKELEICIFELEQGAPFSAIIKDSALFPGICYAYLRVGEESGCLAGIFEKLQDHYQNQLEYTLEYMINLIEPLFMVLLCFIVGALMMALYLPIINLGHVLI